MKPSRAINAPKDVATLAWSLDGVAADVFLLAHKYNIQPCLDVCTRLVLASLSENKASKGYVLRWLDTADSLGHMAMKTA